MMKTSIFLLIFLAGQVYSAYHVYTYTDSPRSDEHCCLVRLRDKFCLAAPVTRSLIQIDRNCHRIQRNTFGKRKQRLNYLDKIHRRLEVQSIREKDDSILIELRKPLEQPIVDKDLHCLASNGPKINLQKCYADLAQPTGKFRREQKGKFDVSKRVEDANRESQRVQLSRPVTVRERSGLALIKTYHLNSSNIRVETREQRQCLSWLKKFIRNVQREKRSQCIEMNDPRERCFEKLLHGDAKTNEFFLTIGSKLFCENSRKKYQLLAIQKRSKVCLNSPVSLTVEHIFGEIGRFSDEEKRNEIIKLINKNEKFRLEFEHDCFEQQTLIEQMAD